MVSWPIRVSRTRAGVEATYVVVGGKYPFTSTTRCTGCDAKRQTAPPTPIFVITALGMVTPTSKLRLDAVGRSTPHGYTVTKPAPAGSVTVTFNVAATASAGT